MKIREEILVNQAAQGVVSADRALLWFNSLPLEGRRSVLRDLAVLILQASPTTGDVLPAIDRSAVKPSSTAAVLVQKEPLRTQMAKIASLPEHELTAAFRLFVSLLGIADERRKRSCNIPCRHWWHRDLADKAVVTEIENNIR